MIFVDTGAFIARYLKRDQYHARAEKAWSQLAQIQLPLLTSILVLGEAINFVARRAGNRFAAEAAGDIYQSARFDIIVPGREEQLEALNVMAKYADQSISFTDAVSFVLMRQRKIKRAFTFDHHFRVAGFTVWP